MRTMTRNPVARLSAADRTRRLQMSFDKGDRVRQDRRNPDVWLVSSSTHANVHYRVQYQPETATYSCGCKWWHEKQQACRHLTRISWELWQARKLATKEVA